MKYQVQELHVTREFQAGVMWKLEFGDSHG